MSKLIRVFAHQNSNHYLKALPLLTASYNSTIHSSTKFAPNAINQDNQYQVFRNLYKDLLSNPEREKPKYKEADPVRISLEKQAFEKVSLLGLDSFVKHLYKINSITGVFSKMGARRIQNSRSQKNKSCNICVTRRCRRHH